MSVLEEGFPGDAHVSVVELTTSAELQTPHDMVFEPFIQLLRLLSSVAQHCVQIQLLQLFKVPLSHVYNQLPHSKLSL